MLKDLPLNNVHDIAFAIAPENSEKGDTFWNVYIINYQDTDLTNVLINSRGYGEKDGKQVKTSILRHGFHVLGAGECAQVELIDEQVFGLSNEYFLTYYIDNTIYDKRFVFLPETINTDYLVDVPILGKKGIMIR